MKKINDEVTLKKELDSIGIRYGSTMNDYKFYIEFVDNKGWVPISHGIYSSPIVGIRQLNDVIQKTKLPDKDIDIVLGFAFKNENEIYEFHSLNFILDPFIYYEKPKEVVAGQTDKEKK